MKYSIIKKKKREKRMSKKKLKEREKVGIKRSKEKKICPKTLFTIVLINTDKGLIQQVDAASDRQGGL